jgi:hypothetical protein
LAAKPDRVLVGDIGRPQGLQGEVRIRSFTAEPASIAEYGPLEDETGTRLFEIESLRVTAKALTARLKGVESRDQAEALTGTKLFVPRSRLPERAIKYFAAGAFVVLRILPGGFTLFKLPIVQEPRALGQTLGKASRDRRVLGEDAFQFLGGNSQEHAMRRDGHGTAVRFVVEKGAISQGIPRSVNLIDDHRPIAAMNLSFAPSADHQINGVAFVSLAEDDRSLWMLGDR